MVSADNVNYDVLTLIFAFLGNHDLVSTSLVSKSFKAGATPRLYRSIYFRLDQMKRWPRVTSPFSTILAHPGLGVHVRYCDIKSVPKLKGQPHPLFLSSCADSLALCPNLLSFTCTSDVPPFLPMLPTKERLTELKLHATLGTEQTKVLTRLDGLHNLVLYQASLSICHALPKWIPTLGRTLTSLTITYSRDFNEVVLELIMLHMPRLRGLHVMGCPRIGHQTVLQLVSRTPLLESLSFTTWENPSTSFAIATISLPHLLHLSIDTRCSFSPHAVPPLYNSIFSALAACPLTSLTFKLSERMVVGDTFITQVVDNHGSTLTRLNAVNVSLTEESMELICTRCYFLKQLAVVVPVRDLDMFSDALISAYNLHTLIDVGDSHSTHGPRATLSANDVRELFRCAPELRTIISGNRCWTCERIPIYPINYDYDWEEDGDEEPDIEDYEIRLKLERLKHSSNTAQHLMEPGC